MKLYLIQRISETRTKDGLRAKLLTKLHVMTRQSNGRTLPCTAVRVLRHGRFGVRFPVGGKDVFLLRNVQTGSGDHPASYSTVTGVPSRSIEPTSITNAWNSTSSILYTAMVWTGKNSPLLPSTHSFSYTCVELRNNLKICGV